VQRLSNSACRIKDLISQTHIIYHSLNAVQKFYALRHPVRRPCSSRADLEHSTVSLHIECEDMTTAIGEHAGLGQEECPGARRREGAAGYVKRCDVGQYGMVPHDVHDLPRRLEAATDRWHDHQVGDDAQVR